MNLFIDTDVILDTLLMREPHFSHSADVLVLTGKYKCCTSVHGLINVHYFTKKKFGETGARKAVEMLTRKLTVVTEDETIVNQAIPSHISDFEDAVQFYAAKSIGAEAIITRNIKDYKNSTIPVFTPEQFLRSIL